MYLLRFCLLLMVALYSKPAYAQLMWPQQIGGLGYRSTVEDLTFDAVDNAYCVGYFKGTAQSGFGALTAQSTSDIYTGGDGFLAKYSSQGQPLWIRHFGQAGSYISNSTVASDLAGNVYWLGFISGGSTTISLDGTTLTSSGEYRSFLAKYSAQGQLLWAKIVNPRGGKYVNMCLDTSGAIYVAGSVIDASAILKLDDQGTILWANPLSFPPQQQGVADAQCTALAMDSHNQLWVGASGLIIGSHPGDASSTASLSRYNSQGTLLQTISTPHNNSIIFSGSTGTVYAAGKEFNGGSERITGYDTQGAPLWSRIFTTSTSFSYGVKGLIGPDGNLYLPGYFTDDITIGNTTFTATSGQHSVIVVLSNQGAPLGAMRTGMGVNTALVLSPQQALYLAGGLQGTSLLPGVALSSRGLQDGFVTRLQAVQLAARQVAAPTGLTVYPNPVDASILHISWENSPTRASAPTKLRLCNALGQIVREEPILPRVGAKTATLTTIGLVPGTYLLSIYSADGINTQRVVLE